MPPEGRRRNSAVSHLLSHWKYLLKTMTSGRPGDRRRSYRSCLNSLRKNRRPAYSKAVRRQGRCPDRRRNCYSRRNYLRPEVQRPDLRLHYRNFPSFRRLLIQTKAHLPVRRRHCLNSRNYRRPECRKEARRPSRCQIRCLPYYLQVFRLVPVHYSVPYSELPYYSAYYFRQRESSAYTEQLLPGYCSLFPARLRMPARHWT